jgi:predicted nucleic acid-binding protein
MTRYVLLDTGVLGQIARRRPQAAIMQWVRRLSATGARLVIPEVCDYELRRESLRARLTGSLQVLDSLAGTFDYLPIETPVMRLAAQLWAAARQQGLPTADVQALDGDVLLAAQAQILIESGHDAVVATGNPTHLARFVPAERWQAITV